MNARGLHSCRPLSTSPSTFNSCTPRQGRSTQTGAKSKKVARARQKRTPYLITGFRDPDRDRPGRGHRTTGDQLKLRRVRRLRLESSDVVENLRSQHSCRRRGSDGDLHATCKGDRQFKSPGVVGRPSAHAGRRQATGHEWTEQWTWSRRVKIQQTQGQELKSTRPGARSTETRQASQEGGRNQVTRRKAGCNTKGSPIPKSSRSNPQQPGLRPR